MKEFPKNYDFNISEKKWQNFWQQQKIYLWDKNEARENSFVVDTPPTNSFRPAPYRSCI